MNKWCVAALAGAMLGASWLPVAPVSLVPTVLAQSAPEQMTEDEVISGTMKIEFGTRTNLDTSGDLKAGSAAIGAQDKYTFQFNVAKTTQYSGTINRQPKLYSSILGREKQAGRIQYAVDIAVLNPRDLNQKRNVGKWVGEVPVDPTTGAFQLGTGDSPLRIVVDTIGAARGFQDRFAGKLVGKAEKKEGLAARTYKRVVGGKTVERTVTRSDPMTFDNIELAKGPAEIYPRTIVSGRLDYDYETGNWYTDGIRFKYTLEGKTYEDVVTGSIKWVEDPARATNGKGHYEFNLRFNEDKDKKPTGEDAAFQTMSAEEAFFAVDNSVPSLTGRIEYTDSFISGGTTPRSSEVVYRLNANRLTKQQVVNFFKLWLIAVGPTNDE
jgi:hypothetical protein